MFLCSFIIDDLIRYYSQKMKTNFFSQLINNVHSSTYLSIFYLFNFGSVHSFFPPTPKAGFICYLELSIHYYLLFASAFWEKTSYMNNYALYSYMYAYRSS